MRISLRLALLALLLTAACAGPPAQSVPGTAAAPTEAALVSPTPAVAAPTEAALRPTDAAAVETATTAVEPTEASAAPTETRVPRLHLEATDPSTVTLAAGKPQLVEFFAFW